MRRSRSRRPFGAAVRAPGPLRVFGDAFPRMRGRSRLARRPEIRRIERTREKAGEISPEIAYAVTSLTSGQADPARLLALWRAHWLVDNRLHWRRAAALRADRSRIRSGSSPQALAVVPNALLHVVRNATGPLAEIRETFAEDTHAAVLTAQNASL